MKRDMELIRKILFAMEAENEQLVQGPHLDGYPDDIVMAHLVLCHEAGLILAGSVGSFSAEEVLPVRLTWQGHEFLAAARDDSTWNRAKEAMAKTGGVGFEVAKQVLVALTLQATKGYLGLP